jgi:hypothetical protein
MFLLSTRLRRFIAMAVVLPLTGRVLQKAAGAMTARSGPTPAAARMDRAGAFLRSRKRVGAFRR